MVHLASDDVLLRTMEYSPEGKAEDKIHYYYGPNIAKIRVSKPPLPPTSIVKIHISEKATPITNGHILLSLLTRFNHYRRSQLTFQK